MIGALAAEAMAEAIVRAASKSAESSPACRRRESSAPCRRGSSEIVHAISADRSTRTLRAAVASRRTRRRAVSAPAVRAARRRIVQPAAIARRRSAVTASPRATARPGRAVIWSRTDRPARMVVEYSTTESFDDPRRSAGSAALESTDFTARLVLTDLPRGSADLLSRALPGPRRTCARWSAPETRQLHDAAGRAGRRDVTLAWSADTVGQGWGINPEWGGLRLYETMRRAEPDVFIHCGDTIYADQPLAGRSQAGRRHDLEERRDRGEVEGRRDARRVSAATTSTTCSTSTCAASTPMSRRSCMWDDHEVRDNWYDDARPDEGRALHGQERGAAGRARAAGVSRVQPGAGLEPTIPSGSTAPSRTARWSTSSRSTCAAIAARTARTGSRR